jgi:hypothetical protein
MNVNQKLSEIILSKFKMIEYNVLAIMAPEVVNTSK